MNFQPSRNALSNARFMPLAMMAVTPEAHAFVAAISDEIEGHGKRRNKRRSQDSQEAHRRAVGATLADLLLNWQKGLEESLEAGTGTLGGLSYRSLSKGRFTGQVVSARDFADVRTGFLTAGFIEIVMPKWAEFLTPKGDPEDVWAHRRAARIAPTDKLLSTAADTGIALADVRRHFITDPDASAKETAPVIIERLKVRRGRDKVKAGRLPLPKTPEAERIVEEVEGFNEFAAGHRIELDGQRITLCWHRLFNVNFALHGRWYIRGESYQTLSRAKRVGSLTIDGEAVAEVDLSASCLTCLYGYLHERFDPSHDPYRLAKAGRKIVKAFVNASLGKGQALVRGKWPPRAVEQALKDGTDLSSHNLSDVSRAVLKRHPIMADLPGRFAWLAHQFRVAKPQDVFANFLMGLEARAVTAAMIDLKKRGVLALPVHDSLIVPQSAVEITKAALVTAFQDQLGVTPRLKVEGVATAPVLARELTPDDPEWWRAPATEPVRSART